MKDPPKAWLLPARATWRQSVETPRRRAWASAVLLALVACAIVARVGTIGSRLGAVSIVAAAIGLIVWQSRRERAAWQSAPAALLRVRRAWDPTSVERALRGISLADESSSLARGTSRALRERHLEETLGALSKLRLRQYGERFATRLGIVALVAAGLSLFAIVSDPWRVVEGWNILVARGDRAPLSMHWLAHASIEGRPPEYLHTDALTFRPGRKIAVPAGTLLTMRGNAERRGRLLYLSADGDRVPFADDGRGGLVARWPVKTDVTLQVVAVFGDVEIAEDSATIVSVIADEKPKVNLEGAPRTVRLDAPEAPDRIPLRYEATDDHGLREVHVVMRSGAREERRVLAQSDSGTRTDRGGYVLKMSDPFVAGSHAPVELRIEARDNDVVTGPKWGASEAITIVPAAPGVVEAERLTALGLYRGALVDALAGRIDDARALGDGKAAAEFGAREAARVESCHRLGDRVLIPERKALELPPRVGAIVRTARRRLDLAERASRASANAGTLRASIKANEELTLVVDGAYRGLGLRDARDVALRLADVADDLVLGIDQLDSPNDAKRGRTRVKNALALLDAGGRALSRLDTLGRDIGEIVEADLVRVRRAEHKGDRAHFRLAAEDLAARLRVPDPSFSSEGGGSAGGESGGARGTSSSGSGQMSEAERAFHEAAGELDRLVDEHSGVMGEVEQAMSQGARSEDVDALKDELLKHARAVRKAAESSQAGRSGSSDPAGESLESGRRLAEDMARALEEGRVDEAASAGRAAMDALGRSGAESGSTADGEPSSSRENTEKRRALERALDPEVKWAERALDALKKQAAQRSRPQLGEAGEREGKLAERARRLADEARRSGALPDEAVDALRRADRAARDAAQSLRDGQGASAMESQRDAQRELDRARQALFGAPESEQNGEDGDRPAANQHADIPKADDHEGPRDFRQRVLRGLGRKGNERHSDAVRRYAEGLLR